jgi:hypothetical protein
VTIKHDLYKNIININMCVEFEIFKVEVPLIRLGTVGVSLRRDGRY